MILVDVRKIVATALAQQRAVIDDLLGGGGVEALDAQAEDDLREREAIVEALGSILREADRQEADEIDQMYADHLRRAAERC